MLVQIFKSVLFMSLAGGALSLFWLCLKPVTEKIFSPGWQYYIWLTVLAALLIPAKLTFVRIPLPQNVPAGQISDIVLGAETAAVNTAGNLTTISKLNDVSIPQNIMWYLSVVWLIGAASFFAVKVIKYMVFLRTIHKNSAAVNTVLNIPKRLSVRRTDMLDAPLLTGIIKPVLYLPDTYLSEEDMNYILMHELTHYKRLDILYKWAAMAASCMHWFNPFAYLAARQIDSECEVSCDFAAAGGLSEEEQKSYMGMILRLLSESKNRRPLTTQMAGGKKTLKRRFDMIKSKKKTNKFTAALSAILALTILSTTVFAGGILSGLAEDSYVIEVTGNGEKLKFSSSPFTANNTVYLPLRELLNKTNYENIITWDNNSVDIGINDNGNMLFFSVQIGSNIMEVSLNSETTEYISMSEDSELCPILKNDVTYIPFSYADYIFNQCSSKYNITCMVWSREDGNIEMTASSAQYAERQIKPPVLSEGSTSVVKAEAENYLNSLGYGAYDIEIKSSEYDENENSVTFFIEVRPEAADSYDYLTIAFRHNGEIWQATDFLLEK